MAAETIRAKITFLEPVLGTSPGNEQVYRDFIGAKAPNASTVDDEVAAIGADAVVEKGKTIFPKLDDGTPYFYDYQIKGFFKGACSGLRMVDGSESSKLKAYKKVIDLLIFVKERRIPIQFDGELNECQRPLRAQTMQGERVSLAISEQIPAGASIEFTIQDLSGKYGKTIREWLDYGQFSGIGQWRNSGKGRFTWEELPA